MSLEKLVYGLPDKVCALIVKRVSLLNEKALLERHGYSLATPRWRGGRHKYLYLIHPVDGVIGADGKAEYIGADEKSQKDALARVERGARMASLSNDLGVLDRKITRIEELVRQIYRVLH